MLTLCHYLNLLMSFRYQNLSLSPSCNLCILMFTIFCHHLLKMFGPQTGKEEKQKISQDSEVIRKYSNHLLEPILLVICPLLHCQNFGIPSVMTTLNLFVTKMSSTVNLRRKYLKILCKNSHVLEIIVPPVPPLPLPPFPPSPPPPLNHTG